MRSLSSRLKRLHIHRSDKADTKNEIEQLTYATEKAIKDLGDKIGDKEKTEAEDAIKEAKEKLADIFDLDSGKYILNFDLGERYITPYHVQDNKNQDVFIEEFLLEEGE